LGFLLALVTRLSPYFYLLPFDLGFLGLGFLDLGFHGLGFLGLCFVKAFCDAGTAFWF